MNDPKDKKAFLKIGPDMSAEELNVALDAALDQLLGPAKEPHGQSRPAQEIESAVEAGLARAAKLRQAVLRSAFEGRL